MFLGSVRPVVTQPYCYAQPEQRTNRADGVSNIEGGALPTMQTGYLRFIRFDSADYHTWSYGVQSSYEANPTGSWPDERVRV